MESVKQSETARSQVNKHIKGPVCDIYSNLMAWSEAENTYVCF